MSPRFRFTLLRDEAEREATFKLVAIFVWACFLDHYAHSQMASHTVIISTAIFEAAISILTAGFLIFRVVTRWRG